MTSKFRPLDAPPSALEQGGVEMLRAAVVEGGLHVSQLRAIEYPDAWRLPLGRLCPPCRPHICRRGRHAEEETAARVRAMFDAQLDGLTHSDTTSAVS